MGGPDFALRLPTYSPDGDIRASFLLEFIHLVIQADINDDTAFFVNSFFNDFCHGVQVHFRLYIQGNQLSASYKGSLRDEVKP